MNLTGRPIHQKPEKLTPAEVKAGKLHMARVARLPCVITGLRPVQVHHCICGRYSGKKANDFQVIPLHISQHLDGPLAIHTDKAGWIERNGNDYEYLPVVADMLAGEWSE